MKVSAASKVNDGRRAGPPGTQKYEGETYYGKPAVKSSQYGWLISLYFFTGGLASALQFISTIIDFLGGDQDKKLVSFGRYSALIGAVISPILLIGDLHTPRRWYNMLRIFRPTSPMSIGSWALSIFGTFSGLSAASEFLETLSGIKFFRWFARIASIPAALGGGLVSLYTGTLLATTSTPLWSTAYPFLSSLFASSSASTAVAALTLAGQAAGTSENTRRRLGWLSILTGAAELVFSLLVVRNWKRNHVESPVKEQPIQAAWSFGVLGLGIVGPLAVHLSQAFSKKESKRLSIGSSAAILAGGFILRAVFVFGGKKSAKIPEDYLRLTQPESWH